MIFWIRHFFSSAHAHLKAFEEVFFVTAFSLMPLFLLQVIDTVRGRIPSPFKLGDLFWGAIAAGQLFLYSFALMGTLFYLSQKDRAGRFAPRIYITFMILVPLLVILGVYYNDPAMAQPLTPSLVTISFYIYVTYTLLYYILLVFDYAPAPQPDAEFNRGAKALMKEFRADSGARE